MKEPQGKLSRRTLFAGASTVGAIAAVTAVMPSVQSVAPAAQDARPMPSKGGGYHMTEHIKRYFKTTLI